jgi:hypothetical protein
MNKFLMHLNWKLQDSSEICKALKKMIPINSRET